MKYTVSYCKTKEEHYIAITNENERGVTMDATCFERTFDFEQDEHIAESFVKALIKKGIDISCFRPYEDPGYNDILYSRDVTLDEIGITESEFECAAAMSRQQLNELASDLYGGGWTEYDADIAQSDYSLFDTEAEYIAEQLKEMCMDDNVQYGELTDGFDLFDGGSRYVGFIYSDISNREQDRKALSECETIRDVFNAFDNIDLGHSEVFRTEAQNHEI